MSKEEKLTEQAEKIEQEATEHCNKVLCSVCEKVACTKEIKCREWRDRRAGYYCGAEPKEERIAELIKENQDLRDNYEQFKVIAEPEIERLKKENAELKNRNQELLESCEGATMMYKDLQKAKDLLLRFIELKNKPCSVRYSVNMLLYENICAETVQFLNNEVEK